MSTRPGFLTPLKAPKKRAFKDVAEDNGWKLIRLKDDVYSYERGEELLNISVSMFGFATGVSFLGDGRGGLYLHPEGLIAWLEGERCNCRGAKPYASPPELFPTLDPDCPLHDVGRNA